MKEKQNTDGCILDLLVRAIQETLKAFSLWQLSGLTPEMERYPHFSRHYAILKQKPRDPWVGTYLNILSVLLSFIVPEGTVQGSKRGRQPIVLLSWDAYEPHQKTSMPRWLQRCSNDTHTLAFIFYRLINRKVML